MTFGQYLGAGSAVTKGLWRLNGNSNDSSGNSANGTDANMSYVDGYFGQCGSFNGSNSRVALGTFALGANNTCSVRTKRNGAGSSEMLMYNLSGGTGVKGHSIRTNQGSGATWQYLNSPWNAWVNINTNFQDNVWYNIIVVKDGSGGRSYVNGVAAGSDANTGDNSNTTSGLGSNATAQDFYNGLIDEVVLESKARTAEEVQKYYTYAKGRFGIL